ncbi:MAG: hypothetical protein WCC60_23440 [Ilumatobacteraceae bacterium]
MSLVGRQLDSPVRGMAGFLRAAVVLAFALAVVGALVPGAVGRASCVAMVAVIVAVPLVRVIALGVHWLRAGDRRFAAAAGGLMVVVAVGTVLASL